MDIYQNQIGTLLRRVDKTRQVFTIDIKVLTNDSTLPTVYQQSILTVKFFEFLPEIE